MLKDSNIFFLPGLEGIVLLRKLKVVNLNEGFDSQILNVILNLRIISNNKDPL